MQRITNLMLGVLVASTSIVSAHKATTVARLTPQGSVIARALVRSHVPSPALAEIEKKGAETYRNYVRTMHASQGTYKGRALVPCGPQELLVINKPGAQRRINPVLYVLATSPFLSMGAAAVTGGYVHRNYVAPVKHDKKNIDAPEASQKAYCAYEQERLAEQQEVLADLETGVQIYQNKNVRDLAWSHLGYVKRAYVATYVGYKASRHYDYASKLNGFWNGFWNLFSKKASQPEDEVSVDSQA